MNKLGVFIVLMLLCSNALFAQKDESNVRLKANRADTIAFETLVGVSSYGWDPANKGILINWRRDNPDRVNNSSGGDYDDRNGETRHDSQNDIRALQHYYWFKYLHEGNDFFDEAITRLEPTVREKFKKISSKKGWMYYVLLRLWQYGGDKPFWKNVIMQWGNNVYNEIDHDLGIYYETNMGNCDCGTSTIYLDKAYRIDHQVEAGAAMVDAGTRFNRPEWVDAGYRQVLTAYEQAFAEDYGLFGRIYLLGNSGYKKNEAGEISTRFDYSEFENKIWDGQCKLGEASEEIDALLRAAAVTNRLDIKEKFNEIATKMLTALEREAIHDKTNRGFFQLMYIADSGDGKKAGYLSDSKKEMRQASLLGTYYLANKLLGENWKRMEEEMYQLLTSENTLPLVERGMYLPDTNEFSEAINGYRGTVAGYSYQLNSDWSIFHSKSIDENWVSNESNSLALLGLLQYLTPIEDIYEKDSSDILAENVLIDEDFTGWKKQGATSDQTVYTQNVVYPYFNGDFIFHCSGVDPNGSTSCDSKGRITINPSTKSNSGWLILPQLPSVGLIKIQRDGKAGANMRLDKFKDGLEFNEETMALNENWEAIETDNSTITSGCVEYEFSYTSPNPVQLRITTVGQNSNNLTYLYVEKHKSTASLENSESYHINPVYINGNNIVSNTPLMSIEVFNLSGIKLKHSTSQQVSINDLPKGIYLVKYTLNNKEVGHFKFLK